jgi:murein L,D-transpeptidase YcbB/YkuD
MHAGARRTAPTSSVAYHAGVLKTLITLCALACAAPLLAADAPAPLVPRHFQLLQQALLHYRQLALHPELTRLPPLPHRSLREGEVWTGIAGLRTLLGSLGDLAPAADGPAPDDVLDATLVAALVRFQERHGLTQDGVLGPATYRQLTTPLAKRVRQIEWTLERWRALPPNPHTRAIIVNIPRFRLYALDSSDEPESKWLQIDVVVGKAVEELHTPTISADLTHLIFRPYWDVPASITQKELLPAARRDAAYFARNHYELIDGSGNVVPYSTTRLDELAAGLLRVRQQPGDDNALGAVKFALPNSESIYLHDTPARALFARSKRAESHGCIRVADAAALAAWVLREEPGWTPARISEAMQRTEPLRVNLTEPIRVYIVYGTAIAREDGSMLFLDDLYGLEKD